MEEERPFEGYHQKKKTLQAPFNWLRDRMREDGRDVVVSTWRDERLPEFLWLALIIKQVSEHKRYELLRQRVTAIGGVFFTAKDPAALRQWYATYLGLVINDWGTDFEWRRADDSAAKGFTHWGPFNPDYSRS